jgi:hypothetical protein
MAVYFQGFGRGSMPPQGTLRQSGSGGGAMVRERPAPKQEPRSYGMNVEGVAQYGSAMGNHAMETKGVLPGGVRSIVGGAGYEAVGPTRSVPGVGGGRTVAHCGSQGQHGPVAGTRPEETPKSFPIFGDNPGGGGRRY